MSATQNAIRVNPMEGSIQNGCRTIKESARHGEDVTVLIDSIQSSKDSTVILYLRNHLTVRRRIYNIETVNLVSSSRALISAVFMENGGQLLHQVT